MPRKHLASWTLCLVSLFLFSSTTEAVDPLQFNVTSDNAYRFGLGDQVGISPGYNTYWFNDVWNSTSGQIQNAESYPVNSNNLSYDYFYIACYGGHGVTTTFPYADVVVVIDESDSMEDEQRFTAKLIEILDDTLAKNGIGDDGQNRYGLVGFGSGDKSDNAHLFGHPHMLMKEKYKVLSNGIKLILPGTPQHFGTVPQYQAATKTLKAEGGSDKIGGEDGYSGIHCALRDYPWRQDAQKIIILVTDEDREPLEKALTYQNTLNDLNKHGVTLNVIVTCDIWSKKIMGFVNPGGPPVFQKGMAINSNGTVFLSGGLGVPYTASPGGNIQDGTSVWAMDHAAGTVDDYVDLAFATGGMAGDIDIISGYGTDSYASASGDSFADVLSTQITWQTIQKNPHRGALAEVVDKTLKGKLWFSSQAAKWEVYATGDAGNSNGIWSATNPPTISEINQHIANANNVSNIPGTSKGWIDEQGHVRAGNGAPSSNYSIGSNGKLVTGEQNNSNTGYFNIVSPLNQHTRWMWYNPDPVNVTKPFEYGPASNGQNDGSREFLIFRLKVRDLVPTRRSSDAPKARPSRGDLTRVNPPRSNSPRPKPPRTKPPRTERPKTNLPRDERPGGRPQGRPTGRPLSDPKRVTTESDRTKPSKTGRPTSGRPLNGPAVDRPRGVDRQAVSQPTPPAKPAKGKKGLRKPLGKPTDNDLNQAATDKKRLPPKPDKKKQAAGKEEKAKPLAKAPATPSVLLKK